MANPERGEVDLVTATHTYTLFLSTNALCAMEKRMGKSYGQILQAIAALDMSSLRSMMFAVLQTHHAKQFKTEDEVGVLIDAVKMKAAKDAMFELFTLNTPSDEPKKEGDEKNPPDAQGGTGANSTLTLAVSA